MPRKIVRLNETGEKLEWQRFPVEVAVLEGDFTNNNVTIFYYDEPTIIEDLYSGISDDSIYNLTEKDKLNPALIKSLPANTETYIPIPIDGSAIKDRYEEMEPYFNFSCKYTMENSEQEKIRKGVLTSFPHGTNKYNLFLCETPNWNEVGKSEVRISLNGYDYTDDSYKIEFTDPLYVSQMNPTCGPIEGNTEVEFIGTGFRDEDDFYFKWGPQNIVPMRDQFFFKDATDAEKSKFGLSSSPYRVKKMKVHSPMALHKDNTTGGPDYLSIDKVNLLPLNELLEDYNLNSYKNQKFEYYYYHQVYVDSYYPNSADPSDPAIITVLGAFFLDKPEYNVKPVCKFGNKEVIGTYKSNVRITCLSPEYNKANLKVPFSVSLNGKDFIKAEEPFTFLSALKNANFGKIQPQVGPINGGTIVNIPARGLGKILQSENNTYDDDSEEEDEKTTNDIEVVKCMFQSYENEGIKKEAPGKIEKNNDGSNSIVCTTPGGWTEATKTKVFANFGGDNWVTTANDFFFYDLEDLQPASGPNIGGGYISLNGGGFMKQENTKLALENVPHDAVSTEGNLIQFPLPPSVKSGYVGPADVAISMDGANQVEINEGFYYYEQVNVSSFYPITGPAKGNGKIIVSGKNFRSDFKRANPGCKIGNYYGQGEVLNSDEMVCTFDQFPVLRSKPGKPTEEDEGFDFSVALNNYSFVNSEDGKKFKGYTIHHIEPSSGPISGGTRILIHGSGFSDTGMQRCRFGTPGWFAITQAEYLDPNTLSCISPADFKIPKEGQLPFNVPFSVGLTEDEFEPWTTTSHTFTFYRNPKLIDNDPIEGKTSEIKPVLIRSDKNGTFTVPSPIIFEEIYDVIGDNESHASASKFEYQPIKCKYGRFGVTSATYINETHHIANDKDIGYEKVDLEVALNGEDFIKGEDVTYTFIGPAANRMVWVYILMILFIAILAVILILLATTFLNTGNKDEGSQVRNKRIRYLIDQNLEEGSDAVLRQGDGVL